MDVTIDKPLENIGKNIPVRKKKITQEQQKRVILMSAIT